MFSNDQGQSSFQHANVEFTHFPLEYPSGTLIEGIKESYKFHY